MKNRNLLPPVNILPEEWRSEAFIAGGFAAFPALSTDCDLWVTVPTGNDLDAVRQELLLWLAEQGFVALAQRDAQTNEDIRLTEWEEYPIFLDNRKVARITGLRTGEIFPKPIHLIVTNGDVDQVLSGFDISAHQIALTDIWTNPTEVEGNDYTRLDEEVRILKDTPHTRERFDRINARYAEFREKGAPCQSL
jgi:hypothetical protein